MDVIGFNIPGWAINVLLIVTVLYLYSRYKQTYLKRLGFPGPEPKFFVGQLVEVRKHGVYVLTSRNVQRYGKCYTACVGNMCGLSISDAEMVKEICVKQFSSFHDRSQAVSIARFWKLALTNATGDHWKFMRNIMSPTFSAAKLRSMDPLLNKCLESFVASLHAKMKESDTVDFQKAFGDLAMDVIAATAFGMDVDCQSAQETEFSNMATRCMNIKPTSNITVLISVFFPDIKRVFDLFGGVDFVDKVSANYLKALAKGVIDERRQARVDDKTTRTDLLELMLNAHKVEAGDGDDINDPTNQTKRGLTDNEILSNAVFFLLAGIDTTATALTWCSYCLATNPDCQERLINEIDTKVGKERASYENVYKLQYLDAFVSETLRLYPPAGRTNREAANDVTICGHFIPAGTMVNLAIYAMHRLEEYWPDPLRFDPERFSPENKGDIIPFSYLPFGVGPRSCIGNRLALLEIKTAIVTLLQRYRIHKTDIVQVPPKIDPTSMFLKPADGMSLRLENRE